MPIKKTTRAVHFLANEIFPKKMKIFIETFFGFSEEEMLAGVSLFTLRDNKPYFFLMPQMQV